MSIARNWLGSVTGAMRKRYWSEPRVVPFEWRARHLETDMRKSRFTEEQIIAILAEQERGVPTADVCRKHGLSTATFYKFKAKYGGMDITDARKLKLLETENLRLKRTLADAMLDNVVLKDLLGKS